MPIYKDDKIDGGASWLQDAATQAAVLADRPASRLGVLKGIGATGAVVGGALLAGEKIGSAELEARMAKEALAGMTAAIIDGQHSALTLENAINSGNIEYPFPAQILNGFVVIDFQHDTHVPAGQNNTTVHVIENPIVLSRLPDGTPYTFARIDQDPSPPPDGGGGGRYSNFKVSSVIALAEAHPASARPEQRILDAQIHQNKTYHLRAVTGTTRVTSPGNYTNISVSREVADSILRGEYQISTPYDDDPFDPNKIETD